MINEVTSSNELIIFDLDETLIAGDSALIWHEFLVKQGIITCPDFLTEDRRLMALYALGELDMQAYLDFSVAAISHLDCKEVDRLAMQCVTEQILPRLYPQANRLLVKLCEEQTNTLMISATVSFLVEKIAQKLNMGDAMGIDLVLENNRYTSKIAGIPTFRTGKVERLQQWLMAQSRQCYPISFYTDSINDLPLCLHVDNPIMVNPCAQLKHQAQLHQWPILNWQ